MAKAAPPGSMPGPGVRSGRSIRQAGPCLGHPQKVRPQRGVGHVIRQLLALRRQAQALQVVLQASRRFRLRHGAPRSNSDADPWHSIACPVGGPRHRGNQKLTVARCRSPPERRGGPNDAAAGAYRGVALSALLVMAWPVFEMSLPAPAVAWQAARSGAMPRNASRISVGRIIFLHMKITLPRGAPDASPLPNAARGVEVAGNR